MVMRTPFRSRQSPGSQTTRPRFAGAPRGAPLGDEFLHILDVQLNHLFYGESLRAEGPRLFFLVNISRESDWSAFRHRRMHELANSGENRGDGFIVSGELFIEPGL